MKLFTKCFGKMKLIREYEIEPLKNSYTKIIASEFSYMTKLWYER